jgi:hypothetical protein
VGSGGEEKDGERVAVGVSIRYYDSRGPAFYIRLVIPLLGLITDYIHLFYLFV